MKCQETQTNRKYTIEMTEIKFIDRQTIDRDRDN